MNRVVLEELTVSVDESVAEWQPDGMPRMLMRGERPIAVEGGGDSEPWIRWMLQIRKQFPDGGASIAHVGGGFACIARILGPTYRHTIFEQYDVFARYAPDYARFVPGDWTRTLDGSYDVIVYDIDGQGDRAILESHLNPGGVVLGLEE